jgi:HPt (histidine-containing phosphotransfer) domain-containing protein
MDLPRNSNPETPAATADLQPPVFDRDEMLKRIGDDLQAISDQIDSFLDETPRLMTDLRQALNSRDSRSVERLSHRLKTLARNFGLNQTVAEGLRLEVMGRQGDLSEAEPVYVALQDALQQLRDQLLQWQSTEGVK